MFPVCLFLCKQYVFVSVHSRWKPCCLHLLFFACLWSTLVFLPSFVHFASSCFSDHFLCLFFLFLFFFSEGPCSSCLFVSFLFSLYVQGPFLLLLLFFHTWCFSSFIRWGINQKGKYQANNTDDCSCRRGRWKLLSNLASLLFNEDEASVIRSFSVRLTTPLCQFN